LKCLSLLLALLAVSCTTKKKDFAPEELLSIYEPKWFSANENHSLRDQLGKPQAHLFFDVHPEFVEREGLVNAIVTTPENSHLNYAVDLLSGQRHYAHHYCNQGDVWNQKSGTFGRPYFSIAYMPRVLDQMGEPQKLIIFGGGKRLVDSIDHFFVRVKILGGYMEESCPDLNCLGRDTWKSRLVFIAIDPQDKNFGDVKDLEGLLRRESWERLQPTLQNMDGRNFSVDKTYPYLRVRKPFGYADAIQLFRKRTAFMGDEEIKKIQSACHTLYYKMWTDVGADRPEDLPSKTEDELNKKLKIRDGLREKKMPVGKIERFRKFIKKYFNEAATCEKFVYHGNINLNPERFWFHSYMGMYLRLHKEGHYFDCRRKIWAENVINVNGEPGHKLQDEIDDCSEKDIDSAMEYMPNHIKAMKSGMGYFWRFIDYDTHEFGTHRKIYSWVKMNRRKFDCRPDPNELILDKLTVFPEEASWKRWNIVDVASDMKIIY
jgi:hypothetical protein